MPSPAEQRLARLRWRAVLRDWLAGRLTHVQFVALWDLYVEKTLRP